MTVTHCLTPCLQLPTPSPIPAVWRDIPTTIFFITRLDSPFALISELAAPCSTLRFVRTISIFLTAQFFNQFKKLDFCKKAVAMSNKFYSQSYHQADSDQSESVGSLANSRSGYDTKLALKHPLNKFYTI